MQIFSLILSFYFLGLNLIPCDETVVSKDQETVTVNEVPGQDQHENEKDNEADECSPFCQCHCCHVHIVNFHPAKFEVPDLEIPNLIVQKGENPGQEILDTLFQPPRV